MDESPSESEIVSVSNLVDNCRLPERILALEHIRDDLLKKNFYLHKEVESLKQQLKKFSVEANPTLNKCIEIFTERLIVEKKKVNKLEQQNATLQSELKRVREKRNIDKEIKKAFHGVLTPNQIDIMLGRKARALWTEEELNKAKKLRSISKEGYHFARNVLHYPLPAVSTLDSTPKEKSSNNFECIMKFEIEDPPEEKLIIKKEEVFIKKEVP